MSLTVGQSQKSMLTESMQYISDAYEGFWTFVVCQITQQPPISVIVKSWCLTLFGHVAQMDMTADDSRIIYE